MNTQIVPIERAKDGTLYVSSLTIADGAGVEHRAVLQLIKANLSDFDQFGPSAFEMRKGSPLPQGGFAKSTRVALLNERQSILLMTYQRNTAQVRAFKLALVKAFFEMAKQLQAPSSPRVNDVGIIIGEPLLELPANRPRRFTPAPHWEAVATLLKSAPGFWREVNIERLSPGRHRQAAAEINSGELASFRGARFEAAYRANTLYVRYSGPAIKAASA